LSSLRDGRAVYVQGRRVADVTTDPIMQITVRHSAGVYDLAARPELADLFTMASPQSGEPVSRYFMQPKTPQELALRGRLIEEHTRQDHSTLNLTKAVGTDALIGLTVTAAHVDRALQTDYAARVARFLSHCRENDLSMALAQTDAKGNRSLRPHEQADPDLYVRIVERRDDGIVVRGAKAHTTASPASNEIIVLPTRAMSAAEADYAVAFAVPPATPGLIMICRATGSIEQDPRDYPVSRFNIETESLTVFDDVFVPWERVFLAGEWQYAGLLATTFAGSHRFTAVSYKPPIGDLLIGAAQLAAEYSGIDGAAHVREKITQLIQYTEMIRACSRVAALDGEADPLTGIVLPNPIYTNIGKAHFATRFHEACRLVQDIAGGLAITLPSAADWDHPELRPHIEKYLAGRADVPTIQRLQLYALIRDLTASDFGGYNYVVTLHGEGSLAAQALTMHREYGIERCKDLVLRTLQRAQDSPRQSSQ
jgi:aromatic ring hydroxylase